MMTVRVENPVPLTVIVLPVWVTEVSAICCPIGTDTALLFLLYSPSVPLLLTTNEPGPVAGLGPMGAG